MFKRISWFAVSLVVVGCGGSGEEETSTSAAGSGAKTVIFRSGLPSIVRDATPEEEQEALDAVAAAKVDEAAASEGDGIHLLAKTGITIWGQYGFPFNPPFHQDYCQFPNDSNNKCGIPLDKITKYHWSGATTSSDSALSGINFKTVMQQAISGLSCPDLGWSCTEGGSGSAETMLLGNDSTPNMCRNGVCANAITELTFNGGSQCDNIGGVTHCYLWQNKCKTTMNVDAMRRAFSGLSLASRQQMVQHLMAHEMGHCMGFADFEDEANFTGDQLMWATSPPWQTTSFNHNEANSLFFFQPGH